MPEKSKILPSPWRKWLGPMGLIIAILGIILLSLRVADPEAEYKESLAKLRAQKNSFMAADPGSPFQDRKAVKPLLYYPIDPAFRITARLEKTGDTLPKKMTMSNGETEAYLRYALAHFEVEGTPQVLTLYKRVGDTTHQASLFVPFTDASSGQETYAGGRYLDVEENPDGLSLTLDFNLAYNPYCVYNHLYVCPLPPKENRLTVAIKAGEKDYPTPVKP